MTRHEFTAIFIGYMTKKIPTWLPEESTEKEMLNIMQDRMAQHNKEIQILLNRSKNNS